MDIGQLLGTIVKNNQSIFIRYGVVSAVTTGPSRVSVRVSGSATAVTGIRYLDQGSRSLGDGSRNYVVFDAATIEILRKYGLLPPMLAAGAAGAGSNALYDGTNNQ